MIENNSVPQLIELLDSSDFRLSKFSFATLEKLGERVTDELLASLTDANAVKRHRIVLLLSKIKNRHLVPSLINLLNDPSSQIKISVLTILAWDFEAEEAAEPILKLLREDEDAEVRLCAADALGYVGGVSTLPFLYKVYVHDKGVAANLTVADEAIRAIRRILKNKQIVW